MKRATVADPSRVGPGFFCFVLMFWFFFNQSLITGNSYYRVVKCFGIRSRILCFVAFSGSLFDPVIIVTGISYT